MNPVHVISVMSKCVEAADLLFDDETVCLYGAVISSDSMMLKKSLNFCEQLGVILGCQTPLTYADAKSMLNPKQEQLCHLFEQNNLISGATEVVCQSMWQSN